MKLHEFDHHAAFLLERDAQKQSLYLFACDCMLRALQAIESTEDTEYAGPQIHIARKAIEQREPIPELFIRHKPWLKGRIGAIASAAAHLLYFLPQEDRKSPLEVAKEAAYWAAITAVDFAEELHWQTQHFLRIRNLQKGQLVLC